MLTFFVLSLILGVLLNKYFRYRFDQIITLFNAYKYVPHQTITILKEYFAKLSAKIIKKNILKHINEL